MSYKPPRTCANPRCQELLEKAELLQLCPSCRYIGKIGLLVGAIIAGVLMKVFK